MSENIHEDATTNEGAESQAVSTVDRRWQSIQMLPESYLGRRHAQRVIYGWSALIFVLLATLCGTTTTFWIRGERARSQYDHLVQSAKPVAEMRRIVMQLEQENELKSAWSRAVNSAKPDDSALQALLSTSNATEASKHGIDVAQLEVKLALEHANESSNPPHWAKPRLLVTANVTNPQSANDWLQRLKTQDRIESAELRMPPGIWHNATIQMTGKPAATRVLP